MPEREKHGSDLRIYRRLFAHTRPFAGRIVALLLLSLLAAPLALLAPLPLKIAVDSAIGSDPLPGFLRPLFPFESPASFLVLAAALVLGIALLTQLQSLSAAFLRTHVAEALVRDFRARLFRHVQRLSLAFHDRRGTADSAYRIQYDAVSIRYLTVEGLIPFLSAVLTLASWSARTTACASGCGRWGSRAG